MMAKTVTVVDDIDGSGNADTYTFVFGGQSYSIDLNKKNKAAFDKAMRPYLQAATTVSGRRKAAAGASRRRTTRSRATSGPSLTEVRAWATENGIEVSARGRVAQSVLDAYTAAH